MIARGLDEIFRDEMLIHFRAQLLALWNGENEWAGESVNYRLDGEPLNIRIRWRNYARLSNELGMRDDLHRKHHCTQKSGGVPSVSGYARCNDGAVQSGFFRGDPVKPRGEPPDPYAVIVMDLNNLKPTNDQYGHQAGDKLIRRTAEVLRAGTTGGPITARIGGDEFVALMPGASLAEAQELIERIQSLVVMNNKFYGEPELSLLGAAVSEPGLSLEKVIILADNEMYRNKGQYHRRRKEDYWEGTW